MENKSKVENFCIHLVDWKPGTKKEKAHPIRCDLLTFPKEMLVMGSTVFQSAFEDCQPTHETEEKNESCKHTLPFVEFKSNPHRSFEVLKDFFQAFLPFADWKSKVTFSNVHEWMELGEEFSIRPIREQAMFVIENWLKAPPRGDNKTLGVQLIPIIGALEKFHGNDLLEKVCQYACVGDKWEWFPTSSHYHCCMSLAAHHKVIMTSHGKKWNKKKLEVFECVDARGDLCLATIVETKGYQVKIHYLGWNHAWDTWVDKTTLKEPNKKGLYTIGNRERVLYEHVVNQCEASWW